MPTPIRALFLTTELGYGGAEKNLTRIATGLGALVTLRVAKPISLGVEKSVQRLLNRAANNSVQVPPDPLVVDRDDIRQRNRPILVSHGGFVPLSRLT